MTCRCPWWFVSSSLVACQGLSKPTGHQPCLHCRPATFLQGTSKCYGPRWIVQEYRQPLACFDMFWRTAVSNNCFDLRLVWLLHVPGTGTFGASTLISGAECWNSWHRLHMVCVTPVWIWRRLSNGRMRPSCIHVPSASHLFLLLDDCMHSWQQDFSGRPSQVWCHEALQGSCESNWRWQRAGGVSAGSLRMISSKEPVQLTRLLYRPSFFSIPLILMSSSEFKLRLGPLIIAVCY